MKSIQALREARAKLVADAKALVEGNSGEKWTEDIQAQYDGLLAKVQATDAEVQRIQDIMSLDGDNGSASLADAQVAAMAAHDIEVKARPVYKNIGEQMLDVMAMTLDSHEAPKARDRYQKVVNAASGASTGIDQEGGYLVEQDKSKTIMETAIETGVLSSRCTRQPISANADSFSYLAADDRDRSAGTMNGIQVYRKAEAETLVSSGKALLRERELKVEDMYGLIYVTNRMLRDAAAMAAYTQRLLRKQLSWKLDYEIWQGTGAGQCLGIMNSDLLVSVAKETSQTAKTIVAANAVKMLARFFGDITKAAWFVNQDCLPQLPLMTIGDQPVFVPGGSFENAPFGVLLGRPIVPIEFCSTLGTAGDIVLGDFSQYLLVEKGGVEEAESIHVKFLTDETAFRFIVRNNGQPMDDEPITPLNGTNELSPFVSLAVRS
jgi:HK97 family phage major capsid protein